MLINFFFALRAAKLPVSVKEYLMLLEALEGGVIDDEAGPSVDKFYYLARTSLVKDEANFDKFDRAFAAYFKGVELLADFSKEIPLEWLQKRLELELSPEEKAAIEAFTTAEVRQVAATKLNGGIYALAFSPDSQSVAAAGEDGHVRLISTTDGAVTKEFVPVPVSSGPTKNARGAITARR